MVQKKSMKSQKLKEKQKEAKITLTLLKQKLDLKENVKSLLIFSLLTGGAIAGRATLQNVPSVETITPFSILAGFMLGPVYGFMAGASGFYASNFLVWGGQGPWTIFQMLGAGIAGAVAGIFGKIYKNFKMYMISAILGIAFYELIVDVGGSLIFFGLFGIPAYIITSLPFSAVHLFSTLGICSVLWGFRKSLPKFGHKVVEKYKIGFSKINSKLLPDFYEHEKFKTANPGNFEKIFVKKVQEN